MAAVAVAALLMMSSALPVVLTGKVLFGVGTPWIIVGAITLLQRLTPGALQGRVYSAAEFLMAAPQTLSIAAGAALLTIVDYRWLLVAEATVMAASATYLLTRREQRALASAGRKTAAHPPVDARLGPLDNITRTTDPR